jgi:hypothetical protein
MGVLVLGGTAESQGRTASATQNGAPCLWHVVWRGHDAVTGLAVVNRRSVWVRITALGPPRA